MVNIIFVTFRFFFSLIFTCILKFQQFDSFWSLMFLFVSILLCFFYFAHWFTLFRGNGLEFQSQLHSLKFNLFVSQLLMLIIVSVKVAFLNFTYCLTGYGSAVSTSCSNMSSPTQQTTIIIL